MTLETRSNLIELKGGAVVLWSNSNSLLNYIIIGNTSMAGAMRI